MVKQTGKREGPELRDLVTFNILPGLNAGEDVKVPSSTIISANFPLLLFDLLRKGYQFF